MCNVHASPCLAAAGEQFTDMRNQGHQTRKKKTRLSNMECTFRAVVCEETLNIIFLHWFENNTISDIIFKFSQFNNIFPEFWNKDKSNFSVL